MAIKKRSSLAIGVVISFALLSAIPVYIPRWIGVTPLPAWAEQGYAIGVVMIIEFTILFIMLYPPRPISVSERIKCLECGAEIRNELKACGKCGARINEEKKNLALNKSSSEELQDGGMLITILFRDVVLGEEREIHERFQRNLGLGKRLETPLSSMAKAPSDKKKEDVKDENSIAAIPL